MKFIGNLIWFIFTGLFTSLAWLFLGILWCITVIGIPFGIQSFKMAKLSLFPFGKQVHSNFGKHPIANIIWVIFGGFGIAIGYLAMGLIFCITVIGIPFGKQCFKLMGLAFAPFGASVD